MRGELHYELAWQGPAFLFLHRAWLTGGVRLNPSNRRSHLPPHNPYAWRGTNLCAPSATHCTLYHCHYHSVNPRREDSGFAWKACPFAQAGGQLLPSCCPSLPSGVCLCLFHFTLVFSFRRDCNTGKASKAKKNYSTHLVQYLLKFIHIYTCVISNIRSIQTKKTPEQ